MSERLVVSEAAGLFEFLASSLSSWNRNTLRERLRAGCVQVNGQTVRRAAHALVAGDQVEVLARGEGRVEARASHGLERIFEDQHLIAIDKPSGLLSVSSERQRERTALAQLRDELSRPGRPARLWPVHRLDRETSGLLLFALSRELCEQVRANWKETRKTYLAIVEGQPAPAQGVIEEPLWEDRALNVRVGHERGAKPARTRYRSLAARGRRTLLEVELDTGRRHQIRAHLAWLGHPVLGDARYGSGARRLGLHALRLELPHPREPRWLSLECEPPPAFTQLFESGR